MANAETRALDARLEHYREQFAAMHDGYFDAHWRAIAACVRRYVERDSGALEVCVRRGGSGGADLRRTAAVAAIIALEHKRRENIVVFAYGRRSREKILDGAARALGVLARGNDAFELVRRSREALECANGVRIEVVNARAPCVRGLSASVVVLDGWCGDASTIDEIVVPLLVARSTHLFALTAPAEGAHNLQTRVDGIEYMSIECDNRTLEE